VAFFWGFTLRIKTLLKKGFAAANATSKGKESNQQDCHQKDIV
jgi:hypothetical protein